MVQIPYFKAGKWFGGVVPYEIVTSDYSNTFFLLIYFIQ